VHGYGVKAFGFWFLGNCHQGNLGGNSGFVHFIYRRAFYVCSPYETKLSQAIKQSRYFLTLLLVWWIVLYCSWVFGPALVVLYVVVKGKDESLFGSWSRAIITVQLARSAEFPQRKKKKLAAPRRSNLHTIWVFKVITTHHEYPVMLILRVTLISGQ
jgi:hypothetical protein